jgi:hypothetical protein
MIITTRPNYSRASGIRLWKLGGNLQAKLSTRVIHAPNMVLNIQYSRALALGSS